MIFLRLDLGEGRCKRPETGHRTRRLEADAEKTFACGMRRVIREVVRARNRRIAALEVRPPADVRRPRYYTRGFAFYAGPKSLNPRLEGKKNRSGRDQLSQLNALF